MERFGLIVILACAFPLLASRSDCDTRQGGLTCTTVNVGVQPGQCVSISNPCGAQWLLQDGFRLCDEPEGLTIQTTRARGVVTRELCAASGMPPLSNARVNFLYATFDDFGEQHFNVTVGVPIAVTATAVPSMIIAGTGSQLDASASGGTGTYTFAWTPASSLSNPLIQNPMAFPAATTTYTVTVTDSGGNQATATVTVNVQANLLVTANPSTVDAGGTTQLFASLQGALPPITYSWSANPPGSLSSTTISNPQASPLVSTTFTVMVTDQNYPLGVTGSVFVSVNLAVAASANPTVVPVGGTSVLDALAAGGTPLYTHSWTPAALVTDPTLRSPMTLPLTADTTFAVTVTDLFANSATDTVTVTVLAEPTGPVACFTTIPDPPGLGAVVFDFSCSTGNISLYELWLQWSGDPNQPPTYSGTQTTYQTGVEFTHCDDVRLRVTDGSATGEVARQVCYE